MRIVIQVSLLCAALALPLRPAFAQANAPADPSQAAPQDGTQQPAQAEAAPPAAQPQQQPEAQAAPPSQPAPAQAATPPGQWVYTQQYGWLWMPYGQSYLHVPADTYGDPYMYVYGPSIGWSWVVAPWVWGWGPAPWFGYYGPWRFAWYGHGGWGHGWYGYRAGPAWRGAPYGWHGGGFRGAVPAPPRPAFRAPPRSVGVRHR